MLGGVAAVVERALGAHHHVDLEVADDEDLVAHALAATAIRAARSALRRMMATLARRLSPPLSRWNHSSRNGVTALPRTPVVSGGGQPACEEVVVPGPVHLVGHRKRVGHHEGGRVGAERRPRRA